MAQTSRYFCFLTLCLFSSKMLKVDSFPFGPATLLPRDCPKPFKYLFCPMASWTMEVELVGHSLTI